MENQEQEQHFLVVDTPRPEFEEKIALFSQQEANWNTTPLDISLVHGFFVLVYESQDTLIATGTASFLSTIWIGNVVVAKNHRRKGLASKVVRALEKEANARKYVILFPRLLYDCIQFIIANIFDPRVGRTWASP